MYVYVHADREFRFRRIARNVFSHCGTSRSAEKSCHIDDISPRSSSIAINIPLAPLSLPYLTIRIIVLTMPKDKSQLITWIHVRTGYIISCEEFVLLMFAIRD